MRFGGSLTIFYVGRTTRQVFKHECFRPHKLRYYNEVLRTETRRTPVLLFVTPTDRRGTKATVGKEIGRIEKWLVNAAYVANPRLMNKRLIKKPRGWRIAGVEPRSRGKTSKAARVLRKALEAT